MEKCNCEQNDADCILTCSPGILDYCECKETDAYCLGECIENLTCRETCEGDEECVRECCDEACGEDDKCFEECMKEEEECDEDCECILECDGDEKCARMCLSRVSNVSNDKRQSKTSISGSLDASSIGLSIFGGVCLFALVAAVVYVRRKKSLNKNSIQ